MNNNKQVSCCANLFKTNKLCIHSYSYSSNNSTTISTTTTNSTSNSIAAILLLLKEIEPGCNI